MRRRLSLLSISVLISTLAACAATPEAGIADPDLFDLAASRSVSETARSAKDVATCFEAHATLLPSSTFLDGSQAGAKIYRLRAFGRTYEEIRFTPKRGGGAVVEVRIASNLRDTWYKGFERDRGSVLDACMTGAKA